MLLLPAIVVVVILLERAQRVEQHRDRVPPADRIVELALIVGIGIRVLAFYTHHTLAVERLYRLVDLAAVARVVAREAEALAQWQKSDEITKRFSGSAR